MDPPPPDIAMRSPDCFTLAHPGWARSIVDCWAECSSWMMPSGRRDEKGRHMREDRAPGLHSTEEDAAMVSIVKGPSGTRDKLLDMAKRA